MFPLKGASGYEAGVEMRLSGFFYLPAEIAGCFPFGLRPEYLYFPFSIPLPSAYHLFTVRLLTGCFVRKLLYRVRLAVRQRVYAFGRFCFIGKVKRIGGLFLFSTFCHCRKSGLRQKGPAKTNAPLFLPGHSTTAIFYRSEALYCLSVFRFGCSPGTRTSMRPPRLCTRHACGETASGKAFCFSSLPRRVSARLAFCSQGPRC